jgi:hypothetical protein
MVERRGINMEIVTSGIDNRCVRAEHGSGSSSFASLNGVATSGDANEHPVLNEENSQPRRLGGTSLKDL